MASTYYDSSDKTVIDGDVAFASDLNDINSAVDTALQQVETDITTISNNQPYYTDLAQKWAEEVEDTPVTVGHYSALHWAAKAEDQAILADADRVQTGLDRVQTGLDKVATAADRVQTGLDRIATAADRVQTGLDAAATAADRVQTGLDAAATAQDVIDTQAIVDAFPVLASGDEGKYLKVDNPFSNGYVVSTLDLTAYAPLASPTFTGTPAAPTATAGTNTTQLATTAYVVATAERRMTAVSGLPLYGNVNVFDITKTNTTELTITKGTCLDSTGLVPLALTADTAVSIPVGILADNTIYHIAVVRLVSDGSVTVQIYLSEAAMAADATIDAFRWIGFWMTNGSSSCKEGYTKDGVHHWLKGSENPVTSSVVPPAGCATAIDLSSYLPGAGRVSHISLGAISSTIAQNVLFGSKSGLAEAFTIAVNSTYVADNSAAWGTSDSWFLPIDPSLIVYYGSGNMGASYASTIRLHAVKLRR